MAEIGEIGSSPNGAEEILINPLEGNEWDSLLGTHPESSFFHSSAWARVLHETYGHRPTYFCQVSRGQLLGLLPIMEVRSRLIGIRAISLPFSDFCPPLWSGEAPRWNPYELVLRHGEQREWRYLECRAKDSRWEGASTSMAFFGHLCPLDEKPELLFKRLKGCVRRGIKRAQASSLRVELSSEPEAIKDFYRLHCLTRRRHGLPPQPLRFFKSIGRHVLAEGKGVVVSAFLGEKMIASAVFFLHRRVALFKFGASDYSFQRYRPNNLVMWEAIKWCAQNSFEMVHLGRTSLGNAGLRRFKLGFGAKEELIEYCKYDFKERRFVSDTDRSTRSINHLFRCLPVSVLRASGSFLYPHLG